MKRRGRKRAEGGAAAVEMALVLPILFLLVFGIIEFGFIFNRWISVVHAAREGVRLLSLGDPDAYAKGEATAPELGNDPGVGTAITCTAPPTPSPNPDDVEMECRSTYHLDLVIFYNRDITLRSTARMAKE